MQSATVQVRNPEFNSEFKEAIQSSFLVEFQRWKLKVAFHRVLAFAPLLLTEFAFFKLRCFYDFPFEA